MSFGRRVLTFWRLVSDKLFNVWFRLFSRNLCFAWKKVGILDRGSFIMMS